jgi:hypothetical protein
MMSRTINITVRRESFDTDDSHAHTSFSYDEIMHMITFNSDIIEKMITEIINDENTDFWFSFDDQQDLCTMRKNISQIRKCSIALRRKYWSEFH